MEPDCIVRYQGHEIRVFVLPPTAAGRTFRATYEIRVIGGQDKLRRGTIAGSISSAQEAEEAALAAARKMIDGA